MQIYKENEMPGGEDLYGRNTFAVEKRNAVDRYSRRLEQITRMGVQNFAFEKKDVSPQDIGEFRIGWFHSLLRYYKEYLTEDNFLTCEQAKFKYIIFAPRFQNNQRISAIKEAIRTGELKEVNMIWFVKNGVCVVHEWNKRAIAITQMVRAGERVPVKINFFAHVLDDTQRYPYIDYYPGNLEDVVASKLDFDQSLSQ